MAKCQVRQQTNLKVTSLYSPLSNSSCLLYSPVSFSCCLPFTSSSHFTLLSRFQICVPTFTTHTNFTTRLLDLHSTLPSLFFVAYSILPSQNSVTHHFTLSIVPPTPALSFLSSLSSFSSLSSLFCAGKIPEHSSSSSISAIPFSIFSNHLLIYLIVI